MPALKDLPEIYVPKTQAAPKTGAGMGVAATAGMAGIGAAMSRAGEVENFTRHDLVYFAYNRGRDCEISTKRAGNWFGRLQNRFTGTTLYFVMMSAHRARQFARHSGYELALGEDLHPAAEIGIRYDILLDMGARITTRINGTAETV